jgi:hypothetical protein
MKTMLLAAHELVKVARCIVNKKPGEVLVSRFKAAQWLLPLVTVAALPAFWSEDLRAQVEDRREGTFSIVARDPATGELGGAVQSKAFATGSRNFCARE